MAPIRFTREQLNAYALLPIGDEGGDYRLEIAGTPLGRISRAAMRRTGWQAHTTDGHAIGKPQRTRELAVVELLKVLDVDVTDS